MGGGVTIAIATITSAGETGTLSLAINDDIRRAVAPFNQPRFRAVVSNTCGSVTTTPATLTICAADFDCSGTVAFQDIFAFLNAWFAGSLDADYFTDGICPADFDCSGAVAFQDIFAFLNAWFAGSMDADFFTDGTLATVDIFVFLNAWFAGCS